MNKIITHLKSITFSALYDFVKDQIKSIVVTLISLSVILKFREYILNILKEQILKVLTYEIQIWMALLFILFLCLVLTIFIFQKSKSKHNFVKYGLKWAVKIKNKHVIDTQGPFCTKCGYQLSDLDFSENNQCPKCSKKYPVNENISEDIEEKLKSIVESDLRIGNVLNIDWSIVDFPNSTFSISNNGSFIVKNINVDINMDVNGKPYHIDTYSIDNIPSDETKKIDDSDPMNEVNEILNGLKLVKSKIELIGDYYEDERGNYVEYGHEMKWSELRTEFSSELSISMTYSLRNKIKSTKAKYLLKFKHLYTHPEFPDFRDNFEVSLTEIE